MRHAAHGDKPRLALGRGAPTPDDLWLLAIRLHQLDFDDARAAERARIADCLRRHAPAGRAGGGATG